MCLVLHDYHILDRVRRDQRGYPHPLIAEHDYIVWKHLTKHHDGHYISPFQRMIYTFGATYTAPFFGLHRREGLMQISEGLHARVTPQGRNAFPALLARGTKFFFGTDNDIVMDRMTVFQTLKDLRSYVSDH